MAALVYICNSEFAREKHITLVFWRICIANCSAINDVNVSKLLLVFLLVLLLLLLLLLLQLGLLFWGFMLIFGTTFTATASKIQNSYF